MADQKISDLTAIVGDDLADDDLFEVVDVDDTSGPNAGAGGENKRITRAELVAGLATRYDWDGAATLNAAANVRHVLLTGTLAAGRTLRLPLANAVPAGAVFTFTDASGSITPSFNVTIRVVSGSSDTIDGFFDAAGSPTPTAAEVQYLRLRAAYSSASLMSDGTSKWSITNRKPAVDVQTFTANGTWQRPLGFTQARIILFGGGGGGGSGRRGTTGVTYGGGGGGSGGVTVVDVPLSDLPDASYTVTVGASAAGGAARTSTNNGATGTAGNVTWFSASTLWTAAGGGGGGGGSSTTGASGGAGGAGMIPGVGGGTGDGGYGNPGGGGFSVPVIAPGAGGGGGWNSGTAGFGGGAGGNSSGGVGTNSVGLAGGTGGATTPTAGAAGTAPTDISAGLIAGGAGGGGGGTSNSATASAGGAGAAPGGGGGGGGGSNNANSGAGAAGARGACIIICW
jgi:hypothetical protein